MGTWEGLPITSRNGEGDKAPETAVVMSDTITIPQFLRLVSSPYPNSNAWCQQHTQPHQLAPSTYPALMPDAITIPQLQCLVSSPDPDPLLDAITICPP